MPRFELSVLIATRNRSAMLRDTLSGLARQRFPAEKWELIVIDNGRTDDTQPVLNPCANLNLEILSEVKAGKSRALNSALDVARGDILVFTDDDVTPARSWLVDLVRASSKYPAADLFCGPIVPEFPAQTPLWMRHNRFLNMMFGYFEPSFPEGPLPMEAVAFGANFAVRKSGLKNTRFRLDLGPSLENGSLFNEDTEFVRRIRGFGNLIYVPSAYVTHRIQSSQMDLPSIFERAFHMGRGQIAETMKPLFLHEKLEFLQNRNGPVHQTRLLIAGMLHFYCGQVYQLQLNQIHCYHHVYKQILNDLGADRHKHSLGPSARAVCEAILESEGTR